MTGPPGRRALVFRPAPAPAAAALAATLGVLLLGATVLGAYERLRHPVPFALDFRSTPFHGPHEASTHLSTIKPFFDARGQSLAHVAMTAAVALLTLLGMRRGVERGRGGDAAAVAAVLATLLAWRLLPGPREGAYLAGLAVLAALVLLGRVLTGRAGNALFGGALVAALGVVTVPGFLHPPDYTGIPWWEVVYGQAHYATVVAPADLLGAGRALFDEVRPDYGLVLPVLLGGYERRFGPLDLGSTVRLLIALQALYLALGAWVFARQARGRLLYALLALVTVTPWFHFDHKGLRFPNQTPWRTIGMALALAVLAALSGRARRRALFVLGLTSGAALLLNFESGVAVSVAAAVWACFRFGLLGPGIAARDRLESAGLFGLGIAAAVAALAALVPLWLGEPLDLPRLPQLVANAAFTASAGFSGWRLTADPWPVAMFAHAAFVLLHAGFGGGRPAGARTAFRAAVAALLVVWFAYYANRPHPWNLSSYYLPYGVLFVDLLRFVALRARRRRVDGPLAVAAAVLALVALPNLAFQAGKGARQVKDALDPALRGAAPARGRLLSGVWLADPPARELEERARFIAGRTSGGPPIYLTSDSYLVPKLAGAFPALPVVDFCWQATTRPLYEGVLEAIERSGRSEVYLDAPGTHTHAASYCAVFYDGVRTRLGARFEKSGAVSGWEVWRRRAGPP